MLQFSLVFMLQEQGPRQKTRLMRDITFGVGNSTILIQDGKMKILSHVACFYSKCLAKMKNERPAWQCFLTITYPARGTRQLYLRVAWTSTFKQFILAAIPATSSAEQLFSALRRLRTYLRSTMGQQRVSNIALINIETAYANSVVNNNVIRIFEIFGRRLFKFRFCRFMIIHQ